VSCDLCARNAAIERGEDEHAVARLTTGYVKLMPNQYFGGSTFFQAKTCVAELHQLPRSERARFLHEMVEVSTAIMRAFAPRKLNYELLGNSCPHLHWFLIPRYDTDSHPRGPAWEDMTFLRLLWTDEGRLPSIERDERRAKLLTELHSTDVEIEVAYV
jgi:diadenosine tetraphosphate (Ap4A) HIT family hydrolase